MVPDSDSRPSSPGTRLNLDITVYQPVALNTLRFPEGYSLVGSSPACVRLTGDLVEIRPIAGTRKRGLTTQEDEANAADLLADPKERRDVA